MQPFVVFFVVMAVLCAPAFAYDPKEGSGLPVPRFVSLKSDHVFVRTGPSMDYPIKWIYKREGLPVEVVQEFDAWRRIKDVNGDTGWVHKLLTAGNRTVVVTGKDPIGMMSREKGGKKIADVEAGAILAVEKCTLTACQVESKPFEGWISKDRLWGVYPKEILN